MLYNLKFWTDMEPEIGSDGKPTGEKIPVDWVSYGNAVIKGVASNNVMVSDKVRRLDPANFKIYPGQDGGAGMALVRERWAAIEPHYRAWKEGREVTVDGTPLAAWATLRSEEVDTLLQFRIATVEAVSKMTDTQCSQLPLPNAWGLRDLAKKFLETLDASKASEREQALMDRIAHLESVLTGPSIEKEVPVDERAVLWAELDARGVDYDKRWGPERLRQALNGEMAA